MNSLMSLKSKLMMTSRKSLLLGAAAVLALGAVSTVAATAYVRNTPVLATAADLANSLIGRSATSVLSSEQGSGPGPIAQAVTPVVPDVAPGGPLQAGPTPVREIVSAPVDVRPAVEPQDSPARTALVGEPAGTPPETPPVTPTVTPGAAPARVFIPTAGTTRVVVSRPSSVRPVAARKVAPEICK